MGKKIFLSDQLSPFFQFLIQLPSKTWKDFFSWGPAKIITSKQTVIGLFFNVHR